MQPSQQQSMQAQQYIAAQYQAYQQQLNAQMHQQQSAGASPAPMNAAQAQAQAVAAAAVAQRNSPMVAAQPLTARSPMPQQQAGQQMAHPQQQSYNFAAMNQFNQQMRSAVPHPQLMQHHLANGAANAAAAAGQNGQGTQEQQSHPTAPMVAQYQTAHMFNMNYPQMGMNMAQRVPAGYWSVGRGMPIVNGQHQMSGITGHPQQLGTAGKASGMQGS